MQISIGDGKDVVLVVMDQAGEKVCRPEGANLLARWYVDGADKLFFGFSVYIFNM